MTHGHARRINGKTVVSRLYRIWQGMITRCGNPKSKDFKYYGARGIRVCQRWARPAAFIAWAQRNGYAEDLTIDRINSRRGYTPTNCRWITRAENSSRRNNSPRELAVAA